MSDTQLLLNRWRLVLGKYGQQGLGGFCEGDGYQVIDDLMEFLYSHEYSEDRGVRGGSEGNAGERNNSGKSGGSGASALTVPRWLNKVHELFPKETVEKLENHAMERYGFNELLRDPRVLEKLEPNMSLLKKILSLKGMMRGEVLDTARKIVAQVAEELRRKMETQITAAIMGKRDRSRATPYKCSKNFDFKRTIAKNLKNYDRQEERLIVEKVYFNRNIRRYNPWHILICVDESGSMMENVIHAAVMAGIFAKLPVLSTKLIIFDTTVVDLSDSIDDPVETLMSVQLGGGTDIGQALAYCETRITVPHRSIVVLVSDLCDGAGYRPMYARAKSILEAGARLICLTALDSSCTGMYDHTAAKRMAALGASVAALTPAKLADWIGGIMGGAP